MKGMHFSCHVSSTCCDTHNARDTLYMHALHTLELQRYCSCNIQPEYLASFPGTLPKQIYMTFDPNSILNIAISILLYVNMFSIFVSIIC